MTRVHLFAGLGFYPNGGAYDFQGSFDTIEQAQDHFQDLNNLHGHTADSYWGQIADASSMGVLQVWGYPGDEYQADNFWRPAKPEDGPDV